MPIFIITRHYQKPEVAAVTAKGDPKDLKNSLQSSRCAGAAGRLLPQLSGLVSAECSRCWSRQLRVFVECLYKSSKLITPKTLSYRSLQHVKCESTER